MKEKERVKLVGYSLLVPLLQINKEIQEIIKGGFIIIIDAEFN